MERELALEIVRVTEYAALAASRWTGRGDENRADDAATEAMRSMLDSVSINGTVVIGEGEMDEAPMLYIGEKVGSSYGPEVDVAVDPVEGTELVAQGLQQALTVIAIAPKGQLLHAPDMYMEKLAVGSALAGHLNLEDPLETTIRKAAHLLNKPVKDVNVSILDRERHRAQMNVLRSLGVRVHLLTAGDVSGAIAPSFPNSGIDMYIGSGGAPEGVLAAAALACLGGEIQGRLMPDSEEHLNRCKAMGISNPRKVLKMTDMIGSDDVIFAASGITDGDVLKGVRDLSGKRAETHSIVMRAKTKTIRFLRSIHHLPSKPLDVF